MRRDHRENERSSVPVLIRRAELIPVEMDLMNPNTYVAYVVERISTCGLLDRNSWAGWPEKPSRHFVSGTDSGAGFTLTSFAIGSLTSPAMKSAISFAPLWVA